LPLPVARLAFLQDEQGFVLNRVGGVVAPHGRGGLV